MRPPPLSAKKKSGYIIADYNDLYCLFTCLIIETPNNKHYSTQLKTRV